MSDIQAIALAQGFQTIDNQVYSNSAKTVEDFINEGYTPDEALMLAGFGGYGFDN